MSRPDRRAFTLWLLIAVACVIYLAAYAVSYTCRSPAANLAYFVYAQHGTADHVLYVVFWLPYRGHGLIADRDRHLRDRSYHPMPTGP